MAPAPPILIQGMRRSGTTILYDALLEDPDLHCFYEPFREEGDTPGGGSGARTSDPFAETRALRRAFRDEHHPDLAIEDFNCGGPGSPALELGPELPPHCAGFLGSLLARPEPVMVKETRFYDKLDAIDGLAPRGTVLVHVVRDPRQVAVSMMMGRGRKRADDYADPGRFFDERERRKLWSSRQLAQVLLQRPEYSHLDRPSNVIRILLVWKHTFEATREAGRRLFGERYLLLRNEDLRADTAGEIARIYATAGRPTPPEVTAWASERVRPPEEAFAANDRRWDEAFAALGMDEALAVAGYRELAARASGASRSHASGGRAAGLARALRRR